MNGKRSCAAPSSTQLPSVVSAFTIGRCRNTSRRHTVQVGLCLIDLKLARLVNDPKHLDSLVDVAGYAACLREVSR